MSNKIMYWVAVQLTDGTELPNAWFHYQSEAVSFAQKLYPLAMVGGVGLGKEGNAHSRKWGNYEDR